MINLAIYFDFFLLKLGHGVEKGNGKYNQIHFRSSGINKKHKRYSNPHSNKNRKSKDNVKGYNKFVKTTRRHKREEPKHKIFINYNTNEYKKHSLRKNYKEYHRIHLPMDRMGRSKQIFWNTENLVKCDGWT